MKSCRNANLNPCSCFPSSKEEPTQEIEIQYNRTYDILREQNFLRSGSRLLPSRFTWSIEICVEGSQFIQFKLLVRVANFELRGFLQTVFKPDLSEVRRPQTPTTNPAVDRALKPTSTSTPLAVIDYH